jgi:hypothetical protein
MNELERPKNRWLQIHLSTLLLTVVLLGILLGENVAVNDCGVIGIGGALYSTQYSRTFEMGWPLPWFYRQKLLCIQKETPNFDANGKWIGVTKEEDCPPIPELDPNPPGMTALLCDEFKFEGHTSYSRALIDVVIVLCLCSALVFSSEWLVRRCEARKT